MSLDHVGHAEILQFAKDRVNLPKEKANEYRAQARGLREKLEAYIAEHPDFTLQKMLISGSLAKGTSLRTLNDIDVACYISGADAPHQVDKLLKYLADKLRKAYPNFSPDQVKPQTFCVTVSFKGTGLDVDVVPILYDGDPTWYGDLVSQDDGELLKTCIPRHLEFIRKRKAKHEDDFSQVARLIKFWSRKQKMENEDFRFKSFMIELILAHLSDQGMAFANYPEALQGFFTYIATSGLKQRIAFSDYYDPTVIGSFSTPLQIIDPVNAKNNVSELYKQPEIDLIVNAAIEAGDAIDSASFAITKQESVRYWQKIFGPVFKDEEMSSSYTLTEASTFTITHARHLASKVATDLKRLQRFYGSPSDAAITDYEAEIVALVKGGYLKEVSYGFKRDGKWIEPTLKYVAVDLFGLAAADDDPGKIRPGMDVFGATFYSFLSYDTSWWSLTIDQRRAYRSQLSLVRGDGVEPDIEGFLDRDLTYSSSGRALNRSVVRNFK